MIGSDIKVVLMSRSYRVAMLYFIRKPEKKSGWARANALAYKVTKRSIYGDVPESVRRKRAWFFKHYETKLQPLPREYRYVSMSLKHMMLAYAR